MEQVIKDQLSSKKFDTMEVIYAILLALLMIIPIKKEKGSITEMSLNRGDLIDRVEQRFGGQSEWLQIDFGLSHTA